jgi:two-component system, OmpR family, response regulator
MNIRQVPSERRGRPVRVFVMDDDVSMRQMLSGYLAQHNMDVTAILVRHDVIRMANEADILLLDIRLDQGDGLDLLRKIRSRSDVPIIITTGDRRSECDRVNGLELGADDYMVKPFGARELVARIRAVLRRQETARVGCLRQVPRGRHRFGGWELDRGKRQLTDPKGARVALTKREYALLIAFLDAPQRPLTRENLIEATHIREDVFHRSIDLLVYRLRQKLEADPSAPRIIQTNRGFGYVFTLAVEGF